VSYEHLVDEAADTPFMFDTFIDVDSNGGNVGRFTWTNQSTFRSYTMELLRGQHYEVPGSFGFIGTLGDWWLWLLGP
jgi:hypothetical protein